MSESPGRPWPRVGSVEQLLAQLEKEGIPYLRLSSQETVSIPTRLGDEEGVLHIRWQGEAGLVQFVHPVPLEVPFERRAEMLEALNRVNHQLAVLGFTLNPDDGYCSFRTQAFLDPEGCLLVGLVGALIATCARTVLEYLPALRAVAIPPPVATYLVSGSVA